METPLTLSRTACTSTHQEYVYLPLTLSNISQVYRRTLEARLHIASLVREPLLGRPCFLTFWRNGLQQNQDVSTVFWIANQFYPYPHWKQHPTNLNQPRHPTIHIRNSPYTLSRPGMEPIPPNGQSDAQSTEQGSTINLTDSVIYNQSSEGFSFAFLILM